jgi:hypothetical protein
VPSKVYFDLATWHLINTVYTLPRVMELRGMKAFYADPGLHRRLMTIAEERLGHGLLAQAEAAKIAVAEGATPPSGWTTWSAGCRRSWVRPRRWTRSRPTWSASSRPGWKRCGWPASRPSASRRST